MTCCLASICLSILNIRYGSWRAETLKNCYFISFSEQIREINRPSTVGPALCAALCLLKVSEWSHPTLCSELDKKERERKGKRETVRHRLDWFPAWGHARDRFSCPRFRKQEWPQSHSKRRSEGQSFDDLPEIQRAAGDLQHGQKPENYLEFRLSGSLNEGRTLWT